MIHFKFSKTAGYESIPFAGIGMKLSELKAAIIQKKELNATPSPHMPAMDLHITNAETKEGKSPLLTNASNYLTGIFIWHPFREGVTLFLINLPAQAISLGQLTSLCFRL